MSTPGGLPRLPAVDQRVSMAVLGGVLGIVLVALIAVAPPGRTPIVAPGSQPTTGASSLPPGPPEMSVEDAYSRFARLGSVNAGGSPAQLSIGRAGDLVLQTGRVVAADVFFFDSLPFTRWL